jgi:hypothetical protein
MSGPAGMQSTCGTRHAALALTFKSPGLQEMAGSQKAEQEIGFTTRCLSVGLAPEFRKLPGNG